MRGYSAIGLVQPKNNINVGSVLRAAGIYNASLVVTTGSRYKKASTDTMKAVRRIPLIRVPAIRDIIPYDCVPVAVELIDGAQPLHTYVHPERAFYIFGPEDGTLGPSILQWCRDVIYVPGDGCMNLAACVNVILYDRLAKSLQVQK